MKEVTSAHTMYAIAPINCEINCPAPPPLNKPIPESPSTPQSPITIVPQNPATP